MHRRLSFILCSLVLVRLFCCVFASEAKAEERLYYIHSDHLGSTTVVTDESGNVVSQQSYYPYGTTRSFQSPISNFQITERQYTGQISDYDQTGLYYYNARYYNPQIALFTQADILLDPVAKNNRYSYVGSNPINRSDPSGNCGPICWLIQAILELTTNAQPAGETMIEPDAWQYPQFYSLSQQEGSGVYDLSAIHGGDPLFQVSAPKAKSTIEQIATTTVNMAAGEFTGRAAGAVIGKFFRKVAGSVASRAAQKYRYPGEMPANPRVIENTVWGRVVDTANDAVFKDAVENIKVAGSNTLERIESANSQVGKMFEYYRGPAAEGIMNANSAMIAGGSVPAGNIINARCAVCADEALLLHKVLRSNGISNSLVNGTMKRYNAGHAWVQFRYEGQLWVADPTWGFVLPFEQANKIWGGVENLVGRVVTK